MATWWMQGGIWMWVVLVLAATGALVVGLTVIVVFVARIRGSGLWPARLLAVSALLCASAPAVTGLSAWIQGCALVDEAVASADPLLADTLRAVGYLEARRAFELGAMSSAPLALFAVLALVVALPPTRGPKAE